MDSTTTLRQLSPSQAQKEVLVNELFAAASFALLLARDGFSTSGLVWGYIGGRWGGMLIPNGTITLAANATNYLVMDTGTGTVSLAEDSPNAWDDEAYVRLYRVDTGASTATSWEDHRGGPRGLLGGSGGGGSTSELALDDLTDVQAAAPSDGDVLTFDGDTSTWVPVAPAGGGGSLANLTEALTSSAPNGTYPVVSLTATDAATSVDLALCPKGPNSALLAQIPDGTTTGGDKRGGASVDFQRFRAASNQVASGSYAVIGGGNANRCDAQYAVVMGGNGNRASGDQAVVAGGISNHASGGTAAVAGGGANIASGGSAFVGGGYDNESSASYATIGGGNGNRATAFGATVPGGRYNVADGENATTLGMYAHADGVYGALAHASGQFATAGDAQQASLVLRAQTTDTTQTTLTSNGSSASASNQLVLRDNSVVVVSGLVVVRENATGDYAAWEFSAVALRGANAGTTALSAAVTPTQIGASAGAASWALAIDADTTNGALRLRVTGEAAHTLRWVATVTAARVAG